MDMEENDILQEKLVPISQISENEPKSEVSKAEKSVAAKTKATVINEEPKQLDTLHGL